MTAKRHHYLPQCYLRGFSKPRKRGQLHYVHVFDRSGGSFSANICNVAVESGFNRVELVGYASDSVEHNISRFESEIGPALGRILEARSLKNESDRTLLLNLIGMVGIRNPRQREYYRQFHEHSANVAMESRLEVSTEHHIGREMQSLNAVIPTLFNRKWAVLLAPKGSPGFITCDHPVCLMFSDPRRRRAILSPGHAIAGTELIFPIGRSMAIVGAYEFENVTREISEDGVAGVNGAMVAFADRQVYAADTGFTYSRQPNEKPRPAMSLTRDDLFLAARRKK